MDHRLDAKYALAFGIDLERQPAAVQLEDREIIHRSLDRDFPFSDLSGLETVQVMRYAARVLDYMEELDVAVPLDGFLGILAQARSNRPELGHGADIYRRLVEPARAGPRRIAAHLAITGLAGETAAGGPIGDYSFSQTDYRKRSDGRLTLGTCRLLLTAVGSGRNYVYAAAAVHLGGLDFYCALKPNPGTNSFKRAATKLWERFETASLPALLRLIQTEFGPDEFGLDDVLADGRWDICQMAFGYLSHDLTAELSRLYEQDQRIIEMLHQAGFDLPPELRIITEFTLGKRLEQEIRAQKRSLDPAAYTRAFAIAEEVTRHHYRIDKADLNQVFSEMIAEAVRAAVAQPRDEWTRPALESLTIVRRLRLEPNLDPAQETVYEAIVERRSGFEQLAELAGELGLAPGVMARNVGASEGHDGPASYPGGRVKQKRSGSKRRAIATSASVPGSSSRAKVVTKPSSTP